MMYRYMLCGCESVHVQLKTNLVTAKGYTQTTVYQGLTKGHSPPRRPIMVQHQVSSQQQVGKDLTTKQNPKNRLKLAVSDRCPTAC